MTSVNIDIVLFSVDPIIFTIRDQQLCVLLVKRTAEPFKDLWGLPGGRVDKKQCHNLEQGLALKLEEKTGLKNIFFEQLGTYGSDEMDPRGWSVTTAYIALVNVEKINLLEQNQDIQMMWVPIEELGHSIKLAFWHERLITDGVERLKSKSLYTDLPVNFMPDQFTYPMLRKAYEIVLGTNISRQTFTKRMDQAGIFELTGEYHQDGPARPAPFYRNLNPGGAYYFPGVIRLKEKNNEI